MTTAPDNLINVECRQCRLGEMQFIRSDRSDRRLVWTFRCSHEDCAFEETAEIALAKTDLDVPDPTGPDEE